MPTTPLGRSETLGFATRTIWAGQESCPATGATVAPVYQTATFTLPEIGRTKGYDYSRTGNPTRRALEAQLAALEGARFASAFGSGMAAVNAATSLLRTGDHIVATRDIYGGTHRLFTKVLSGYGIDVTFADFTDPAAVSAALRPNTRILWIETPSNPTLKITDIAAIARVRRDGQIIVADNTFASPYFLQPLALGADIVVHSTTKYLCGHSDVVGGVVITDNAELGEAVAFHQNAVGAIPGPWDAYLTIRGVKTLAVRMRAHDANAKAIVDLLNARDDIAQVYYPGFGGIVSFRPRGGTVRAHAIAQNTSIFALAVSLGGVESLVCSPASMTHGSLSSQERAALDITDDLLRLSVGIEDARDLLNDLEQTLNATRQLAVA